MKLPHLTFERRYHGQKFLSQSFTVYTPCYISNVGLLLAFVWLVNGAAAEAAEPSDYINSHKGEMVRKHLRGVWQIESIESRWPWKEGSPKTSENLKYCFSSNGEAYPRLAADSKNDSADNSGSYWVAGVDILVIYQGGLERIDAHRILSLTSDRMVWVDSNGSFKTTLRRVAKDWKGAAPVSKALEIEIHYR